MDTCIYMIESLRCLPDTITTLLIGYTPIQNKKLWFFFVCFFFKHAETSFCLGNKEGFRLGSGQWLLWVPSIHHS